MKIPYHCPHCDLVSTRKWNLIVHIRRKHPGEDNPLEMPVTIVLRDKYSQQLRPNQQPDFSNYTYPQIDWLDAIEFKDRSSNVQNVLNEVRKLSRRERNLLLKAILNLPDLY